MRSGKLPRPTPSFSLVSSSGLVLSGQLADVHGRRVALYGSLLIAGGASVITGVSFGYWEYFLFKVVLGFGVRWHRRGVIRSVYGTARGSVARVFRRRHAVLVVVGEQLLFRDDSFFSNVQVRLTVGNSSRRAYACCLASRGLYQTGENSRFLLFCQSSLYCVLTARTLKESPRWFTRVWKARGSAGESHRPRERERSRNSSRWSAAAGTSSRHFKTIICCGVD